LSGSSHARAAPKSRRGFVGKPWFAGAVVLFACAVTLPQGSTGFFDSRWVAAGAWLLGVAGWLWKVPARSPAGRPERLASLAAAVLIGWCLVQFLPLPALAIGSVWRGNPDLLKLVAATSPHFSIAVNRFVSLHALCLWSGLGMLAWATSRHLRARSAWPIVYWGAFALGIFQTLAGLFFLESRGGRLTGTFASPDAFGGLLALTLPLTLGLIFHRTRRPMLRGRSGWRWWAQQLTTEWSAWRAPALWAGFGIQWIGLLFSGSVGALLAALAACIPLLVWRSWEHPVSRRFLLGAAAALALLAVVFSIQGHRRSVLNRSFGDSEEVWQSQASRGEIWRAAARLCRQFPLGTGPGGAATVLSMFQTGVHGRYRLDYAHNDTLQYLGDLGWVGFGALVLLLGVTGWQGARGCRARPAEEDGAVWLRRGAWAAFLGALLHAQGEFNLSARPGFQVFFTVVCGLLWAAGEPASADGKTDYRWVRPRFRWVVGAGTLAAAGAVVLSLAAAWAWRLNEGARRGIGLAPDEPRWYLAAATPPEGALDALERANRLAPQASVFLRGAAEVRMALHQLQVEEVAREWLSPGDASEKPQTDLDPLDPAYRQALGLGGVALRVEEGNMLRAAQSAAEAAVASAPWDASARLVLARVLFRRATIPAAEIEAEMRGRQELDVATQLYPGDGAVLAEACAIIATAQRAEDRQRLLAWGTAAMGLNPALATVVLPAWRTGGVSMAQVLQSIQLPSSVLWQLYALLDRDQRRGEARECLALLKRALDEDRPPSESTLWVPAQWNRWQVRQAQARMRWTKESLKHALLVGDWDTVRSLASARNQIQNELTRAELDADVTGDGALAMKRLRLREWAAQGRLPPKWVVEWALMECQAGQSAKPVQDPLLELLCLNAVEALDIKRLFAYCREIADAPILAAWIEAKEAELAGRPAEAVLVLEAQMRAGPPLSRRFLHRLWFWRFQLFSQAGQAAAAAEALARAAELCPTDPDLSAAALPPDASMPARPSESVASELNIGFHGGRMRLDAVWLNPAAGQEEEATLHVDWRFLGLLPPDLKPEVRIRDEKGRLIHRQSIRVDGVLAAQYNRGAPPIGSQWRWSVSLPPLAATGKRLEIALLSTPKSLSTDEGLPFLELAMERLTPLPKETVERTAKQD
jgi:hypothetical protein